MIKVYILSMFHVPYLTHSNHSSKLELRDLSLSLIERLYASPQSKIYLIVAACKIMRLLWSYLFCVLSFKFHHYCFIFIGSNLKIYSRFYSSDKGGWTLHKGQDIGCDNMSLCLSDFVCLMNIEFSCSQNIFYYLLFLFAIRHFDIQFLEHKHLRK